MGSQCPAFLELGRVECISEVDRIPPEECSTVICCFEQRICSHCFSTSDKLSTECVHAFEHEDLIRLDIQRNDCGEAGKQCARLLGAKSQKFSCEKSLNSYLLPCDSIGGTFRNVRVSGGSRDVVA